MTKQEVIKLVVNDSIFTYGEIARFLFENVEWFFDEQEGNYSGDWYMVGKDKEGKYYFFTMSYGSCTGCDWLKAVIRSESREDQEKELGKIIDKILETPIIENKQQALEYAKKFDWQSIYGGSGLNEMVEKVVNAINKS